MSSLTSGCSDRTRETEEIATSASSATSRMLTRRRRSIPAPTPFWMVFQTLSSRTVSHPRWPARPSLQPFREPFDFRRARMPPCSDPDEGCKRSRERCPGCPATPSRYPRVIRGLGPLTRTGAQPMTDHTPDAATRRDWFTTMVRIRLFEEKVQELFMAGRSRARPTCARARRRSRSGPSRRCSRATSRPTPTAATARRWRSGMAPRDRLRGAHGPDHRRLGRRRRVDAPHRLLARATSAPTPSWARACRSRSARRVGVQDAAQAPRRAHVLRRRRHQHRHVPRGAQHGRRLEGAGRVHHHQQPVRRVQSRCGPRRPPTTWPGGPTRTACPASSWTARTSTSSTPRSVEAVERARGGRRAEPAGDEDLPLPRPLALRPGQVPAGRASSTRWKARDPITILGARLAAEGILSADEQDADPTARSRPRSTPPPSARRPLRTRPSRRRAVCLR